jgi:IS30 family transposase
LSDKSKRPQHLTNQKVDPDIEKFILELRKKRNWGPQRISNHLFWKKKIKISSMTVWRVLSKHDVKPVLQRRKKSDYKRYNKSIPGERVQMDVTKLRSKAYHIILNMSFSTYKTNNKSAFAGSGNLFLSMV